MAIAKFRIIRVGPLVTLQDLGRSGYLRFGVPASGPMDRTSFKAANLALGNPVDSTTIEISMGGIELECVEGSLSLGFSGNGFIASLDGREFSTGSVFEINMGQTLAITPGPTGCWCYLALTGNLEASTWLGKTATHSQSGFGGGTLTSGQMLTVTDPQIRESRQGEIPQFTFRPFDGYARVVLGPQDRHFTDAGLATFLQSQFELSASFDRMGYRLNGPKLEIKESLSIPSEPIIRGSIQVTGTGIATMLLSDHQTTGGYPKIATIISADLDRVAQLRPMQKIRFKEITPQDAVKLARQQAVELKHFFGSL